MNLQAIALTFLGVYVVVMVVIGAISYKKTNTLEGFLLGGRGMGAWMSAFAYGTSYFSAVIFIGYAGNTGWNIGIGGLWIGVANAIFGSLLAWWVLADKTRTMTQRLKAKTMPEFFEKRYGSHTMKIVSACIIFVFLVPYSASVYMGLGYMFSAIFPTVSFEVCMLFIAVLTAIYLVLGGYVATAVSDFVQGIIMIVGVIFMMFFVIKNPAVNGVMNGIQRLKDIDLNLGSIFGGANWKNLLSLILLTSFGTWGLPQMIHKFYAIKDKKSIQTATVVSTLFALLIGVGAYFTGSFGRLFLNNQLPKEGYDMIMPHVLQNSLPNVLLSLMLLLILSASMSTLSSVVLTSASSVAVDIFGHTAKNDKKNQMIFIRSLCLVFIIVSFIIAASKPAFILNLMAFSWGIVSGSFIGPYLWGLYWKKTTKSGARVGMIAGFLTVSGTVVYLVIANGFASGMEIAKGIAPQLGVIAMAVSLVTVPVVSLFTPQMDQKYIDKAFGLNEKIGKTEIEVIAK